MSGKVIAIFFAALIVIAGAGMYYLQVYYYYREVTDRPQSIALAGGPVLPVRDYRGIYSVSSPLADRACFVTDARAVEGAQTYAAPTPLIPPRWFDCFDPVALTVKQLSLDAVGAKISANGELTAPEGKTLDTPVGTLHARLEGVNTLIDTLVSMGLVPQEQVTGYRMMLAMFTKPVEGKDEMTSDIEFKEDGSVLANGQQIK